VQEVADKVKSFHSSQQSLGQHCFVNIISRSRSRSRSLDSSRGIQDYTPTQLPIQEEHSKDTTTTPLPSQHLQQQQTDVAGLSDEYIIRRQLLGELSHLPGTITTEVHRLPTHDEGKPYQKDHLGSRSTLTTEFSRQFEFVDEAETGAESAWSLQEGLKHESRADNILVETLPAFAATEHQLQEPQDDLEELQQNADALTSDAFNVAIQHVRRAEPVPLTQAVTCAAEVITLDILKRAMRDDLRQLEASYSGSKCGSREIKLASTIVHRVLDSVSSGDTKWSKKALQATSLLVEDVISSALIYVSRGDDGFKPDHAWSREAIQASCLIVRDVMADAARQASTTEQPTTTRLRQQQTSAHSQDQDLVDVEFAADQHDIIEQPTAGLVGEAARQIAADRQDTTEHPSTSLQPTASPPVGEISSECQCCYDNDSLFNDSHNSSQSQSTL